MFSGSYLKDDVEFLLKVIDIDDIDIEKKELLIQSGKKHYSQMITKEYEPSPDYLLTFNKVFEINKNRFANDILTLAYNLSKKKNILLVSLVRAGTPIGVLLTRVLRVVFSIEIKHYSISIIRDREIDNVALSYIVNTHPDHELIFIDGWTGKGVINKELKLFIDNYNKSHKKELSNELYVVSDISGVADYSVTNDDYLIPSSALNSTISGLVSRSILNDKYIKTNDFHGCKYYSQYESNDLSLWFISEIMNIIKKINFTQRDNLIRNNLKLHKLKNDYIDGVMKKYNILDINHIKPGIGESTRVLLRRVPYIIILKDIALKDIDHIVQLAKEKNVKIIEDKNLPYVALAIIKSII